MEQLSRKIIPNPDDLPVPWDHPENVGSVLRAHGCLTLREVSDELGICRSSCHIILIWTRIMLLQMWPAFADGWARREQSYSQSGAIWSFECWQKLQIWPLHTFIFLPKVEINPLSRRFQTTEMIKENSLGDMLSQKSSSRMHLKKKTGKYFESSALTVEGTVSKQTSLTNLYVK